MTRFCPENEISLPFKSQAWEVCVDFSMFYWTVCKPVQISDPSGAIRFLLNDHARYSTSCSTGHKNARPFWLSCPSFLTSLTSELESRCPFIFISNYFFPFLYPRPVFHCLSLHFWWGILRSHACSNNKYPGLCPALSLRLFDLKGQRVLNSYFKITK